MFTEGEAKAEMLVAAATVDAARQRIDALGEVRLHEAGPAGLMAALAEAESIRSAATAACEQTFEVSCGDIRTPALRLDLSADLNRAVHQRRRADMTAASVTATLIGVAVDLAYDAETTLRRTDIELAVILLERGRMASEAIAARRIAGLTRDPKGWARVCTKRLAALRKIEACAASSDEAILAGIDAELESLHRIHAGTAEACQEGNRIALALTDRIADLCAVHRSNRRLWSGLEERVDRAMGHAANFLSFSRDAVAEASEAAEREAA